MVQKRRKNSRVNHVLNILEVHKVATIRLIAMAVRIMQVSNEASWHQGGRLKREMYIKSCPSKMLNLVLTLLLLLGATEAFSSIKHASAKDKTAQVEYDNIYSNINTDYAVQEIKFPEQGWKVAVSPLQCKLRRENLNGIDFEFLQQAGGNERLIINVDANDLPLDKITELALVNPQWEQAYGSTKNTIQPAKLLFKLDTNKQQTEFSATQARQILLALGRGMIPSLHQQGSSDYLIKVGAKLVNYNFHAVQHIGRDNVNMRAQNISYTKALNSSQAKAQNISGTMVQNSSEIDVELGNTGVVLFEQPYFEYMRCQKSILPVTAIEFKYTEIYFADGSSLLDRDAVVWLKHVVAYLKSNNKYNIKLVKYVTHNNGSKNSENADMARVVRIADYLKVAGIPYTKIAIAEARAPGVNSNAKRAYKNTTATVSTDESMGLVGKGDTNLKQGVSFKNYKGGGENGGSRIGIKISSAM